jgi:hypothetical protein
VLSGVDPDYILLLQCDQTTPGCARKNWYAHMNPETEVMNFCNNFFDDNLGTNGDKSLKSTSALLGQCATINLRDAQRARAATVIHECTHTTFAMDGEACDDYAYGFSGCSQLPQGLFDRSCAPYARANNVKCPNNAGAEGFCDGGISTKNADTYSHVAAGVFFGGRCSQDIPNPPPIFIFDPPDEPGQTSVPASDPPVTGSSLPPTIETSLPLPTESVPESEPSVPPPTESVLPTIETSAAPPTEPLPTSVETVAPVETSALAGRNVEAVFKRQSEGQCPYVNDYVVVDGTDPDGIAVTGYVHFGDSYASGMGTATTSGDSCRVGSNNCASSPLSPATPCNPLLSSVVLLPRSSANAP